MYPSCWPVRRERLPMQQVGTWLSLVERTLGVGEVASSNLVVPTIHFCNLAIEPVNLGPLRTARPLLRSQGHALSNVNRFRRCSSRDLISKAGQTSSTQSTGSDEIFLGGSGS